jgi:hypothetical protein
VAFSSLSLQAGKIAGSMNDRSLYGPGSQLAGLATAEAGAAARVAQAFRPANAAEQLA